MNLKSWLLENFLTFVEKKIDCGKLLDQERNFVYGKLPHLWKVSFIKEKADKDNNWKTSLFVENLLDQVSLWKILLIKEKFLFVENFLTGEKK